LWKRNREICLTVDNFDRVNTYGIEFAANHIAPATLNGYMDADGRVFKHDGPEHGKIRTSPK
jgi:hypothetical protein